MTLPHIGTEERAVYHLVQAGHIDPVTVGLYREPLRRLEARGLVLRRHDGGYVARSQSEPPASIAPPADPAMVTLVVRVPPEMKAALEALGADTDLSKATRAVISRGLSATSGARKRVAS